VVANQAWWYDPPGSGSTTTDAILHRFDKNNHLLWESTYGSKVTDFPENVIVNKEGNFAIIGNTMRVNNGYSLWLFNVDATTGKMLWEYVYTDEAYGRKVETTGSAVALNKNGDYYLTGTVMQGQESGNMYLHKVSKGGRYVWNKTLDDYYMNNGDYVYVSDNGEIYLFGAQREWPTVDRNMVISKWQEL
jgi:hypothetical protein